jgi:hypothetical protein
VKTGARVLPNYMKFFLIMENQYVGLQKSIIPQKAFEDLPFSKELKTVPSVFIVRI